MAERYGLIIVHTGDGKGKTTAALGLGLRAWGQGLRVLMLQFIKGSGTYGELQAAEKLGPDFVLRQMGEGFIKGPHDKQMNSHQAAAGEALQMAQEEILSEKWDMVILDEINYAIRFGLIPLEKVLELLAAKPPAVHVVLTGLLAKPELIARADLVTEMREIKHPFRQGMKAQKGIEF